MAVSVAAKQLKAGSVALGSLWKVVATVTQRCVLHKGSAKWPYGDRIIEPTRKIWGCPGVPVHEGIPIVFITIHGLMTHSLMFPSFVYRYTRTQPKIFKVTLYCPTMLFTPRRGKI